MLITVVFVFTQRSLWTTQGYHRDQFVQRWTVTQLVSLEHLQIVTCYNL